MHIIKIVFGNDRGGIYSCETQYIDILKAKGVIVHLIIVGDGINATHYEQLVADSIRIKGLDIRINGGSLKRLLKLVQVLAFGLKYAVRLRGRYQSDKISAIIYRREAFMFLGSILARMLKCRCYWHMANTVNTNMSRRLHTMISKIFGIIPLANSIYTKGTLGEVCKYVIYPGFDSKRLDQQFSDDKFNLPIRDNDLVYGMIARVCHDKAQDTLIEGFVKSDVIKAGGHLILAGNVSGEEFLSRIKSLAGHFWNRQVHYIGLTNEVSKFYGLIDIAINARRDAEPFGISIAEALYMRKPILSFYLGGPSEMIDDGQNGWLIYDTSPDAYLEALNKSYHQRSEWKQMGEHSFQKSRPFDSVVNVDRLLAIIKENEAV